MFIGSEWAGARAEASSAHKVVESRLNELQAEFNSHAAAVNSAYQRALEDVAVARRQMTSLPSAPADIDALADAVERIGTLDLRGSHAHQQVLDYRTAHTEVAAQLAAEKGRQHQAMEDAVPVKVDAAPAPDTGASPVGSDAGRQASTTRGKDEMRSVTT